MLDKEAVIGLLREALDDLDSSLEEAETYDAFEVADHVEAAQKKIQRAINRIEVA